jgi:hypothetical protein
MIDPVLGREVAHYERRYGRLLGTQKQGIAMPVDDPPAAWLTELIDAADRAGERVNASFDRAVTP